MSAIDALAAELRKEYEDAMYARKTANPEPMETFLARTKGQFLSHLIDEATTKEAKEEPLPEVKKEVLTRQAPERKAEKSHYRKNGEDIHLAATPLKPMRLNGFEI